MVLGSQKLDLHIYIYIYIYICEKLWFRGLKSLICTHIYIYIYILFVLSQCLYIMGSLISLRNTPLE